jgi:hypothetical protein
MGLLLKRWFPAALIVITLSALTVGLILSGASGSEQTTALTASSSVITCVLGVTATWAATRDTAARAVEDVVQKTLEQRLDDLAASMHASAQIVQEVSAELEARAATAKSLKEEAETAEALSRLHKEESEAVSRMIHAQLETATREIRRDSIKVGILSFVGGAAASLLVTLLVHPLG